MSNFQNFVSIVSAVMMVSSLQYVTIIKGCYSFVTKTKTEKSLKS